MGNVGTRTARHSRELLIRGLLEQFGPGAKLPAEAVLARDLGVSRNTLREALEELRVRGAVTRTWGVGTYMSARPATIDYTLSDLVSINALVTSSGRRCTEEHSVLGRVVPPSDVQRELQLPGSAECWHTARRYFADDVPMILVDEFLRCEIEGTTTDPADLGMDLIKYGDELGHPLAYAEMHLQPIAADEYAAAKLAVPAGTLLLRTRSVTVTRQGIPLVYSVGSMRTDEISLKVIRTPPLGG